MPIFSFGLMVKDTFLSTRGRFSRYLISAFSKTTSPSCGQSRGGALFLIRAGASRESVFKEKKKRQSSAYSKQNTRKEHYQLQHPAGVLPCRLGLYQFMMSCVAGCRLSGSEMCCVTSTASLFHSCCLDNDTDPSCVLHQWNSKCILGLLFMTTSLWSFVALQTLDVSGCKICSISMSYLLCYARVTSADSDTEENAYVTHCIAATLFLLFLILPCSIKPLSQSGLFQLSHFCP